MKIREKIRWIALGGLAFWLPVIILSAIFHDKTSWVSLNAGSLLGLTALGVLSWMRKSPASRWAWVLAGVYIFGPASTTVAGAFAGAILPSLSSPGYLIFDIVICLLPPLTAWLSLYNGMFVSVFPATVVLVLLAAHGRTSRGTHRALT
jgi:hypothetical protein